MTYVPIGEGGPSLWYISNAHYMERTGGGGGLGGGGGGGGLGGGGGGGGVKVTCA